MILVLGVSVQATGFGTEGCGQVSLSRTVFYGLKAFQTSWATTDMRSTKPGGGSQDQRNNVLHVL